MYEAVDWSTTISTGISVGDLVGDADVGADVCNVGDAVTGTPVGTFVGMFVVGCAVGAWKKHNGSDISSKYESNNAVANALHPQRSGLLSQVNLFDLTGKMS